MYFSEDDDQRWNSEKYINIIKHVALPFMEEHDLELQQDNAPIHRSEET